VSADEPITAHVDLYANGHARINISEAVNYLGLTNDERLALIRSLTLPTDSEN
jgi:hypothetical protein